MKTLAIANQNGGVGKTTTAVNLAVALGARGKRVLLIDADPQGASTGWLLGNGQPGAELADVLTDSTKAKDAATPTPYEGVSIIPATNRLAAAEKRLTGEPGAELILRHSLAGLKFDFIFVDCPPSLGLLAVQSLAASDQVLIPVAAEAMALRGLATLTKLIDVVQNRLAPGLSIAGIVPTLYDARLRVCRETIANLEKHFARVFGPIRNDVKLKEAPAWSKPIQAYAPESRSAEDFRTLADQILKG